MFGRGLWGGKSRLSKGGSGGGGPRAERHGGAASQHAPVLTPPYELLLGVAAAEGRQQALLELVVDVVHRPIDELGEHLPV